jgi:hypothetical protein
MVASKSTQVPKVATQVPDGTKPESRVKRFSRWVGNDLITEDVYFLPSAEVLLAHLALPTLVLVIDGSGVGRGCVALMMHVVYKGRALPVAWLVRHGKKGHFPEELHIALVKQVQELIPPGTPVVLLGDGEFDGIALQQVLEEAGGSSVCRTAMSTTATLAGEPFRLDALGAWIKAGTLVAFQEVFVTSAAYGPIMVLCCWAKGYQEPLYLVSNRPSADQAGRLYQKRFRIETFFADQQSRGFHLHQSHISAPKRWSRLLIAAC